MAKKASLKDVVKVLAKERGLEITDIERISGGGLKGRLEAGAGFGEAFSETGKEKIQDIKKTFSKEGLKSFGKDVYRNFFKGDDIFSAYARGRLNKAERKDEKIKEEEPEKVDELTGTGFSKESSAHIQILAENTMGLNMMSRDINVMRQNLQELVKLWSDKKDDEDEEKKSLAPSKADIHFRSEKNDRERLKNKVIRMTSEEEDIKEESETERTKDIDFFKQQDEKEAQLEAGKGEGTAKELVPVPQEEEKKEEDSGGGIVDMLMSMLGRGLMSAVKFLFNPRNLLKLVTRAFPIAAIALAAFAIFKGLKKGFETGSFKEGLITAWGTVLDLLTFGMFGEDTVRQMWDAIADFLEPLTSTISNIFDGIKNFFVGLFGGKVDDKDKTPKEMEKVKPEQPKSKGVGKGPGKEGEYGKLKSTESEKPSTDTKTASDIKPPEVKASSTPEPKPTPVPKNAPVAKSESSLEKISQGDDNLRKLEIAEGQLQNLLTNWNNEKAKVSSQIVMKYRDGFVDDPSSPEYPIELKAVDDKYKGLVENKQKEIKQLKKAPGVKEAMKRQQKEDQDWDKAVNAVEEPSKVAGSKIESKQTINVTGGGETTISTAKTPDAKKAEAELNDLNKKQREERLELVKKLKQDGKIKGKVPTTSDYATIPELSQLQQKQKEEQESLIRRIEEGTSTKKTVTPGASGGGGSVASPSGGGSGSAGAMSASGGGSGSAGSVSATGSSGAPAGSVSSSSAPAGGSASSGPSVSASAPSATSVSPTPTQSTSEQPNFKVPSGSDLSSASSEVAEKQRMESAADQGSVVNAPVTTNNMSKAPQTKKQKSDDVYDSDLASRLAYS